MRVTTPPAVEPLTTAEGRAHLRQDMTDDDFKIDAAIMAARAFCETFTRRKLITQTVQIIQTGWGGNLISLGTGEVQSITSVQYVDDAGVTQTVDAADYRLVRSCWPFAVAPSYGKTWPSVRADYDSVTIELVAGYGDGPEDVPDDIKHAMRLLLGHFYENPADEVAGTIVSKVSLGARQLLLPHVIYF